MGNLTLTRKYLPVRPFATLVFLVVVFGTTACSAQTRNEDADTQNDRHQASSKIDFPELGPLKNVSEGISRYEIALGNEKDLRSVWIYLPNNLSGKRVPCILVAAAGSRLIDGASLGPGSAVEHIPYVRAGFAVIAYDIDGAPKDETDEASLDASAAFVKSDAGLLNQKLALESAFSRIDSIDPNRLYIAGHSSAGTHALFIASRDERIKGVIAFAPATNPEKFLGENLDIYDEYVPGLKRTIADTSPSNNVNKINVPVFLFHSLEDEVVDIDMSDEFAKNLAKRNSKLTFIRAEEGGHHSAMTNDGIPKAIAWLKATF